MSFYLPHTAFAFPGVAAGDVRARDMSARQAWRRPAILTWPVEPRSRWTQPRDESECAQRSDGGLRLNSDRRLARAGRYGSPRRSYFNRNYRILRFVLLRGMHAIRPM